MVFTVNRKDYCRTLFFHRILISRFSDVEDKLHFNLADFPVDFLMQYVFLWWWAIPKIRIFNLAILLKSRKSWKFNAREIYMFYGM